MTSQRNEELPPLPGSSMSASGSRSSHNTESTSQGNPEGIDIVRRMSPMPESPQPMSADDGPPDDGQTRPLRAASGSQSLPRISPPPPGVLSGLEPSSFPRHSTYGGNGSHRRRSELDWILPVEPKREAVRFSCSVCVFY